MKPGNLLLINKAFSRISKEIRRLNNANVEVKPIQDHEVYGNRSEKISVMVNAFLAVLTLLAIVISYRANQTSQEALNYSKVKDSLNDFKLILKDSIDSIERKLNRDYIDSSLKINMRYATAMETQSGVSQTSASFHKESVRKQIRAYFLLEQFKVELWKLDTVVIIGITMNNLGATPAYDIKVKGLVMLISDEKEFNVNYVDTMKYDNVRDYAGAGQTNKMYQIISKEKLTQNVANEISSGKKYIFVLAVFDYIDVFNIKHRTKVFAFNIKKSSDFYLCSRYNNSY